MTDYTALDCGIAILREAHRFVDMHEVTPNAAWSRGADSVELIRRLRETGWQLGWPYCAALVEVCAAAGLEALGERDLARLVRKRFSPSVMETYDAVRPLVHRGVPAPGAVFFMRKGRGRLGHEGIVVLGGERTFLTIEGNTSPGIVSGAKDREGDGIYCKIRRRDFAESATELHLLGFLDPVDAHRAKELLATQPHTET